jgi:colicin import membrane protein
MTYITTLPQWIHRSGILLLVCSGVCVANPQSSESERDRIAKARGQAQATYDQGIVKCKQQFAVTDCEQQVAKTKRAQLDQLNREEMVIKDQERKSKAAKRLKKLDERSESQKAGGAQPESHERKNKIKIAKPMGVPPETPNTEHGSPSAEKRSEDKYQEKLRAVQTHQERVRQANQSRIKPAASSLPIPQ